jgi:DNA-binding NarL/FixJ family response regulator
MEMPLNDAVNLALQPPVTSTQATAPASAAVSSPGRGPSNLLTTREIEVLRLVAVGLTNPDIAEHLSLSIYTVQSHLRTIFSKLNIGTRSAAVRYVFEHNLS